MTTQPTTPNTTLKPDPNFLSTYKQVFPEYASVDNATLGGQISNAVTKGNPQFFSSLKQRLPSLSKFSNDDISTNIESSLQATANVGGLSSGNQEKDLGITDLADTSGFSNTAVGKIVGSFVDGIKQLGTYSGSTLAIPKNTNLYKNAVNQYTQTGQNLTAQIAKDKSAGKDTTRLEKALATLKSNAPQLSDFFDQTTLRRMNQSTGKNFEEMLGTAINAGLDASFFTSGIGDAADAATKEGVSLGSKILKGAKIGATYGATGGLGGSLAQGANAGDVANSTAEGGLIGGAFGAGGELVAGGISNKIQGEPLFGNLAKVPEKLQGDEGVLSNVPKAKEQILEAQDLTKKNIKDSSLPTASDVQGNRIHQEALTTAKTQLDAIGTKMQKSLENPAVGGAQVTLDPIVSDFESNLKKRPPVASYGDNKLLNDFTDDLNRIGASIDEGSNTYQGRKIQTDASTGDRFIYSLDGEAIPVPKGSTSSTIKEVDDFLRKWQSTDASKQMQNNSVGALIDSTVHNINEATKKAADTAETAAGIDGHPYRESNDEYRNLIQDYNDAKDSLGTKRPSTGKYDNSATVFGKNGTKDNPSVWKNIENATGVKIGQPAALTKFIEDIYNSDKPYDVIKNARLSYNPIMVAGRNLLTIIGKGQTDPDAIVQKLLQYIDSVSKDSSGKLTGTVTGATHI